MNDSVKETELTPNSIAKFTRRALRTWYPVGDPRRFDLAHLAMGIVGELGEVTDLFKKRWYKPGYSHLDFVIKTRDELGDLWYYLRVTAFIFAMKDKNLERVNSPLHAARGRWTKPVAPLSQTEILLMLTSMVSDASGLFTASMVMGGEEEASGFLFDMTIEKLELLISAWCKLAAYMIDYETYPASYYTTINWQKLQQGRHGWTEEKEDTITFEESEKLLKSIK
jgi:hypothetical protein